MIDLPNKLDQGLDMTYMDGYEPCEGLIQGGKYYYPLPFSIIYNCKCYIKKEIFFNCCYFNFRLAAIARMQNTNKIRLPWQSCQSSASNVEKKRTPNPLPEVCVTSVQGKLVSLNAISILFTIDCN